MDTQSQSGSHRLRTRRGDHPIQNLLKWALERAAIVGTVVAGMEAVRYLLQR